MRKKGIRVAVGLSGGVDSSVTAALLREKGYEVIGITMRKYDGRILTGTLEKHSCYSPKEQENIEAVSSICNILKIPFHVVDLKEAFKKHVIEYFRREYLSGRTPNPCVVCNQKVKFGILIEKVKSLNIDFQYFATGHYARIVKKKGLFLLQQPVYLSKDQTYFLYRLSQTQLSKIMFPLGEYTKSDVRGIARVMNLGVSEKPESQDFMGGREYSLFFNTMEKGPGDIVNDKGQVMGTHKGIIHYTVGQRRGLGIASDRPLYVIKIDAEKNRIVVSNREHLFSKGLIALNLNIAEKCDQPLRIKAKIRSSHNAADAMLFPEENGSVKVIFDNPQLSVTPGQSVVFYSGNIVLGGGVIERALTSSCP